MTVSRKADPSHLINLDPRVDALSAKALHKGFACSGGLIQRLLEQDDPRDECSKRCFHEHLPVCAPVLLEHGCVLF